MPFVIAAGIILAVLVICGLLGAVETADEERRRRDDREADVAHAQAVAEACRSFAKWESQVSA